MRALPAALTVLSVVLLPAVGAQVGSPAFQVTVVAPSEPLPPGGQGGLVLRLERVCPNAVTVLDSQQVAIQFLIPEGSAVSGPAQASFSGQTCASEPRAVVEVPYVVHVPATAASHGNATGNGAGNGTGNATDVLSFQVRVHPQPSGPVPSGGSEVSSAFTIAVERPEPAAATAQPVEQAAPSPAFASVGLALLAAAVALRRRA